MLREWFWLPFDFEPKKYVQETKANKAELVDLQCIGEIGEKSFIELKMNESIQHHIGMQFSSYKIIKIQKIINMRLWRQYKRRRQEISEQVGQANECMMFHGSAAADKIAQSGFLTNLADSRNMFGAGVYFSVHSSKSNQYVFSSTRASGCSAHDDKSCSVCVRMMLLCRVTLGNVYTLTRANKMQRPPSGYHSVEGVPSPLAGGLRYPEYVVYEGDQAYPEYLITYTLVK